MSTNEIKQELGFDASKAIQALGQLDDAMARFEQRLQSTGQALAQFNRIAGELPKVLPSLQKLGVAGSQSFGQLANSGQRAGNSLRSVFEDMISVHGRYSTSLALLSRIVFTQAVVSGFRQARSAIEEAVDASIKFQKQLAEIQTIANGSLGSMSELSERVRGVSSEFNIPLPDVAKATYEALSAQIIRTGDDFKFMEAAARFSRGSLTSMADTVTLLSGVLNAYGLSQDHAERLASQFFKTIDLGTINGRELATQFGTVATLGGQLGVSTAELNAALATLTVRGVNASTAATQLRGVLTGLIKPSDELTKTMHNMGFASAEAAIKAHGLGGLLRELQNTTGGTAAETAEFFNNVRGLAGALSIGVQGADLYAENLAKIEGVSSSLNKSKAIEVMGTDAEKLGKRFNTFKNNLIPVGDFFVKTGAKTTEFLAGVGHLEKALLRFNPSDTTESLNSMNRAGREFRRVFGGTPGPTAQDWAGKLAADAEDITARLARIEQRRASDLAKHEAELGKVRFRELENFAAINRNMQTEAESAANQLISVEKQKIAELSRQLDFARDLIRDSPNRIANIQARQDRRNFDGRTSGFTDSQKSFALIQRAQQQMGQAEAALVRALSSGTKEATEQARALFEAAQATGEEAASVAQSAGDRRAALFAARELQSVTDQQLSAERRLAAAAQARIPTLEQQRAKQQQSLDLIQAATKELIANSTLFDKQGNKLNDTELAKAAEVRQRALQQLAQQGVSSSTIAELSFKTNLQQLGTDLSRVLSSIDSTPFETAANAIQGSVGAAERIARSYERAAKAASQLGNLKPQGYAQGGLVSYFANGGMAKGTDTVPAMLTPGEFVMPAKQTRQFYSQLIAMKAGVAPTAIANSNSQSITIGDIHVNSPTANPQQTAQEVVQQLKRAIRRGAVKL